MATSETDRLHLYEIARDRWGDDDAARILMNLLPPDPDRFATGDQVALTTAVLRTEMADLRTDLRTEMADLRTDLRTEMAELRGDLLARMNEQTRTIMLAMVGMWLSVAALVVGLHVA